MSNSTPATQRPTFTLEEAVVVGSDKAVAAMYRYWWGEMGERPDYKAFERLITTELAKRFLSNDETPF